MTLGAVFRDTLDSSSWQYRFYLPSTSAVRMTYIALLLNIAATMQA